MGLSVGIVEVNYLEIIDDAVLRFVSDLRSHSMTGLEEYYCDLDGRDADDPLGSDESQDEYWDDGGFIEFQRIGLIRRAMGWAISKNLADAERVILMDWLANLPWKDDRIMLHLGY